MNNAVFIFQITKLSSKTFVFIFLTTKFRTNRQGDFALVIFDVVHAAENHLSVHENNIFVVDELDVYSEAAVVSKHGVSADDFSLVQKTQPLLFKALGRADFNAFVKNAVIPAAKIETAVVNVFLLFVFRIFCRGN